ncbi:hypothetical protein [Clostridium sp. 'deep sea']|nr:hypothetical protein [Clostridium sp. 'deep sea']
MRFIFNASENADTECTRYCEYLYCDDKAFLCVPKVCRPLLKAM